MTVDNAAPRGSSAIDASVMRAMFGEDTVLFLALKARLVRDFREFALPVSIEMRDPAALSYLRGRLHKLAGGAGLIGATTVHRLAEAVEATLAAGLAPHIVGRFLQQLAAALAALDEELYRSSQQPTHT